MEQVVVISLDAQDIQELERILMDRDEHDAFRFLQERIDKKLKAANKPHCKPPFDG
jgi:hypothetical protein